MGQRNTGIGAAGSGRRDARHHLERDARLFQAQGLFAATAEYEGVAPFQAHHAAAATHQAHQELVDLILRKAVVTGSLSDTDARHAFRHQVQDGRRHQAIIDHHIGLPKQTQRLQRQEFRVPGTRAHQKHPALLAMFTHHIAPRHNLSEPMLEKSARTTLDHGQFNRIWTEKKGGYPVSAPCG